MPVKKVLIADDEPHVTYVLSHKLRQLGYAVTVACDGEEAYQIACAEAPDLIVTDFEMPNLTGLEMAVKLKETAATEGIPLLMLTARGHRVSPGELQKTNIQSLMSKPFSLRDLGARIAELVGPGTTGAGEQPVPAGGETNRGARTP
jgi:CheY-like chemotaxis protein